MKIPNKPKLQQTAFNPLLDIEFMKLHSFLVIDAILTSDNPSRFRKILLERI